jgi:vacuolar-type H+-ATPase subunit E/Vma4
MAALGVESRSVFETWLEKEKEYLESLTKEPEEETLQMEYYQKLVSLQDYE